MSWCLRLCRKPWLLGLLVAAALLAVTFACRQQVLPSLARWLNVGQPPRPADYVLVLPGNPQTRPFVAAAWVRAGLASKVLVPTIVDQPEVEDGIAAPEHEITSAVLERRGVPPRDIILLGGSSASTLGDARALADFLAHKPASTVAVVTNHFHTRRARWAFHRVLGSQADRVFFVSAPMDHVTEENWWRLKEGWSTYLTEYCKFAYYLLRHGSAALWLVAGLLLAFIARTILRLRKGGRPAGRTVSTVQRSIVAAVVMTACTSLPAAQGQGVAPWRTGAALERRLAERVSISWSSVSLRRGLQSVSQSQQVALLLDRRVDPGQPLDLELDNQPLRQALEAIAESRSLGLTWLGPVGYFGPPETTARLRTVAAVRRQEIAALPPSVRRVFAAERAWQWDDLAVPRELIEQLADEAELPIARLDRVPHDLWAAADLPPLSLSDRLTLVLAQFDLTFGIEPAEQAVTLVPLPEKIALVRSYPGGGRPGELAARWAERVPDARIEIQDGRLVVTARLEDHERLRSPLPRDTAAPPPRGTEVHSLTVRQQPVGSLLRQLARKLDLELAVDEAALREANISLDTRVSFSVSRVPLEELLRAALEPAGLGFRLQDRTIEVFPDE